MDYDDNEFQSQTFQLADEENIKFSSGLRSYSLPKFDLDDNLQVHLRYDSLVESDVLLGIHNQDENQWIEDFSGGSSGIEFGSSATESCTLSKRNNVWSEATSSESVEMLLKSVGQDEMIMEKTIIERSDGCDDSIANQMEPDSNQDGSAPSKMDDAVDVGFTLPPDKCLENFSGLIKDAGDQSLQLEATPQNDEGGKSGTARELDPSMVNDSDKKKSMVNDENCSEAKQKEDNPLFGGSEGNERRDDFTASESMQVDSNSVQNFAVGLQKDEADKVREHQVLSGEAKMGSQIIEENRVELSDNNSGKPFNSAPKADSMVQMKEASSVTIFSENYVEFNNWEGGVLSKDVEMGPLLTENTQEASFMVDGGDDSSEVHSVLELDPSRQITQGHCNVESSEKHGDLLENDDQQMDCEISVSNAEALPVEESTLHFFADAHVSSYMQVESMQKCDKILSETEGSDVHISHLDVSVPGKENGKLATDPGNEKIETYGSPTMDKRASSSSPGPSTATMEAMVHELPSCQIFGNETVSTEVVSEVTNLASKNELNGVHHLLLGSGGAEGEVIERNEVADSLLPVEDSTHLVKTEETLTKISMEPSSLIVKESSQADNDLVSNSVFEKGVDCDDGGGMISKIVCQPSSPMMIDSTTCQNEPQASVANKPIQQCSTVLEEHPVVHDSSEKEKDGAEVLEKCEKSSIKITGDSLNGREVSLRPETVSVEEAEFHALEAGSNSPNINELNCGSPTVISCVQVSQTEKEHQEGDKGSLDEKAPISEDIDRESNEVRSTAHVPKDNDAAEDDKSFSFEVSSLSALSERETINGWKPFPSIQSYELPQTVGSSSTTSGLNQSERKTLQEISLENPDKAFGKNLCQSSKGDAECKTMPVSGKAADDENTKGKSLKDDRPQSGKELKERGSGFVDQKTHVSDDKDGEGNIAKCVAHDPKENVVEVGKSSTFEVCPLAGLSERETSNGWKPFPSTQPSEIPQKTVGMSQTTSVLPHESPRTYGGKNVHRSSKGNVEDKTRPLSGKATNKETAKDGIPLKETLPTKQKKVRGSNSLSASPSSLGDMSQVVQEEGLRPIGYFEGFVQTSNLPDLNTSVSPSASFQQPFTDFQQVQLRAQILVYGSLLQGTAPDEACMFSAFGGSDSGRSSWENVWRVAVERLRNQKSPISNSETPLHLHSGARVPESATRQSVHKSEAPSTPVRAGNKGPPSTIINPVMPLSSPLWTISTPSRDGLQPNSIPRGSPVDSHQMLFPLHAYQSPHVRHYVGNTTPWLPQPPSSGTWVATPQPALPISETVHVTSVRESSVPLSPFSHTGAPPSVPAGTPLPMESKMAKVSPGKRPSADSKPRKRKKISASEEPGQITLCVQPQKNSSSTVAQLPTSVITTTPAISAMKVTSGSSVLANSPPMSSTHYQIIGSSGQTTERRVIFSEETSSKIEQARQQAEDASALAASAVKHSQSIWSQLATQKNSRLASDIEATLASSAVAIAAAASVAKAAAAAAKVASNAALQAKLMAEEVLFASKSGNPTPEASFDDGLKNLGKVTPASILKGKDKTNNSDSILVATREAARRRVEAASAATKRAENLDALVKAAGMAAEAVSQAGTIIAMGEPIPVTLSELVEAGPDGYWKVQRTSTSRELANIDGVNRSVEHFNVWQSNKKETLRTTEQGKVLPPKEISRPSGESNMWLVNDMQREPVTSCEKGLVQKGSKMPSLAKTIGVVPESQTGSTNASISAQSEEYGHQLIGTSKEISIKEGSLAEVLSDKEGLRGAWFSAKVLSLKDGKACVTYTDLMRDEGSGQPTEWVPLGGGDKAPRIRMAHPMTSIKYGGGKKRSRAARGDYAWSVGDKVDALISDGWWEGVIKEKSKDDETNLIVHIPAQGDVSVRAWNLRFSLIWEDGKWVEWSRSRDNGSYSHEGGTPQEQPPKKSRHGPKIDPPVEARGKDQMSTHMGMEESGKTEASRPLPLSDKEKIFTLGKKIKEDNKSDALITKRVGLQKEGSRVIFGVPKPGKTKKYIEVSKHYDADRGANISEVNDSVKFAKYLIPQASASLGWKNSSKVVSKGKQVVDSKPKVSKSGVTKNFPSVRTPIGHDENMSEKQNPQESASNTRKITEGTPLFSSLNLPSNAPPASKRKPPPAVGTDLGSKRNSAPSGEKLVRKGESGSGHNDNHGKSIPDAVEPRRSNRRIQPTSRLLEGLQSSLTISKIPAASHDKSTKAQQRSAFSRGSNRGG